MPRAGLYLSRGSKRRHSYRLRNLGKTVKSKKTKTATTAAKKKSSVSTKKKTRKVAKKQSASTSKNPS